MEKDSDKNLPRSRWRLRYNRHSSAKATGSEVYHPTVSRRSNGLSLPGTDVEKIAHASYEQAEYALITGEDLGSIGAGKPGEVGYMPPDPLTYDDAMSGVDAVGWRVSMAEERRSPIEHYVFE